MSSIVVVGAQWGDEGKGKVVDVLAKDADAVIRYAGGNNAGHTLCVGDTKLVTHLVPSGCAYPGTQCLLGAGMVVDLEVLGEELEGMRAQGYMQDPNDLRISYDAHLILPFHRNLDVAREERRGEKAIGTTKRGIGPAYASKALRCGIRMRDLLDDDTLQSRLVLCSEMYDRELREAGFPAVDVDMEVFWALRDKYHKYMVDVGDLVAQMARQGQNILFEGAQGAMLDIDHGTYPYVTSSNTTAGAVCAGVGIGPTLIDQVWGITKAYTTRVGNGPFPTKAAAVSEELLRKAGSEFGATTGRPRDCGWIDLPQLAYSARVNGMTGLCVTKLDTLAKLPYAYICEEYKNGLEPGKDDLSKVKPKYSMIPSWDEPDMVARIRSAKSIEDLPYGPRWLLAAIEKHVKVPVVLLSTGPKRSQALLVREPWQ